MNESPWTRKLCRELTNKHGALCIPLVGGRLGLRGLPDRLIVIHGKTFYIEFKRWDGRVKPLQLLMLQKLEKRGQLAFIVQQAQQGGGGLIMNLDGSVLQNFETSAQLSTLLLELSRATS